MPTVFSHAGPGLALATLIRTPGAVGGASHGILDAMTSGGPGVALFAPFDGTRHFLPWGPIPVSPISPRQFFTQRGLDIMQAEIVLIWLPSAALASVGAALRRGRRSRA